jgi:hypothetical protein
MTKAGEGFRKNKERINDESTISHVWFPIFSTHAGIPDVGF